MNIFEKSFLVCLLVLLNIGLYAAIAEITSLLIFSFFGSLISGFFFVISDDWVTK